MSISSELEALLPDQTERELQLFLESYPKLLEDCFHTGAFSPYVIPQMPLGNDFVTDFVVVGHRSFSGWDINLVEIETATDTRNLFTQRGHASGKLLAAERQLNEWGIWMDANRSYFLRELESRLREAGVWDDQPELYSTAEESPIIWYRAIVGRRSDYGTAGDDWRRLKFRDSGNRVEFTNWDRVLEKAQVIDRLSEHQAE